MDFVGAMDFFTSTDGILCLIVGAIAGALATQFIRGGGLGLIGNIILGAIGGLIGGYSFDVLNIIDVGDYADPIIASLVGAAIFLVIGAAIRR